VSASKRKKAKRAALAARIEVLRTCYVGFSDSGREILPGTREYEKRLLKLATMLSDAELKGLTNA
jgi:hypothetical protein